MEKVIRRRDRDGDSEGEVEIELGDIKRNRRSERRRRRRSTFDALEQYGGGGQMVGTTCFRGRVIKRKGRGSEKASFLFSWLYKPNRHEMERQENKKYLASHRTHQPFLIFKTLDFL